MIYHFLDFLSARLTSIIFNESIPEHPNSMFRYFNNKSHIKMTSMLFSSKKILVFTTMIIISSCSDPEQQLYPDPLPPEEALNKFEVMQGFDVEIFAAEPYVFDPVALEFDAEGNVYVVEMPDYPYEVKPGEGKGRIRLLEDTNGDGRIDQSKIFAENITEATSILPWKGGLIVTAAPDILYIKDTDGDGMSDTREVLFTGFFQDNSEAQITSLRFGVDNWIYANNRGQHGMVTFKRRPDAPAVPMRGADFRFRLDRNEFEVETGPGQFGQTIDDWGHRFFTGNSTHIQQVVIPWRYTHRHPCLPSPRAVADISDHEEIMYQETEPPYWRAERTRRRNERYQENNLDRVEYAEDHFTGATGGTIYTADAFPEEFYGNIFTGDVSGNLVHRDILIPGDSSPVYIAKRTENGSNKEFLFSTDSWFRPVDFTVGPDGYLYVVDYYRQHIETPVSIPDDLKKDMDFLAGSDMGRIYRILPESAKSSKDFNINLKNAFSSELVEVFSHPNQWWRLQAQRLLLERQDETIIPEVKKLFVQSQDPRARLHALYVLEGLNALDIEIVKQAMKDDSPGVRENGLILAERFLPQALPQIKERLKDPSLMVALQATLSLGGIEDREIVPAFAQVVERYGQDPWFRMAVLASDTGSTPELLEKLFEEGVFSESEEPWKQAFVEDIAYVIGCRNQEEEVSNYLDLLSQFDKESTLRTAITGLIDGMKTLEEPGPELKAVLEDIDAGSPDEIIKYLKEIY